MVIKIWGFIAFSLWIVALVMYTVAGEFAVFNLGVLLSAIILSGVLAFFKRKELLTLVRRPYWRKASISAFRVFLVLCILAMLNTLAVKTSKSFDFTSSKLHSLSEQSKMIAKQIKEETKITLFAKRELWDRYLALLRQYANENKNIHITAVDVEENPSLTKLNNVEEDGSIVVESAGRKLKGVARSELQVTNLLIKSMRERKLVVYYTSGHGELDRRSEEAEGGSFLFGVMNDGGYELRQLDTLQLKSVPSDADAVLVLGPKHGFLDFETQLLKDYLQKGGNVFILLGPNFKKSNFDTLRSIMAARGIRHHNALVLDRLSAVQGANATIPIVNRYNHEHTVTKSFEGRTLFPLSAALEENKSEGITYSALAMSSAFPASWAESQLDGINSGKVFYNKGMDLEGPVALLAVSESSKDLGKLAVSASADFISNAYQNQSSNFNLFMNTLAWLMDDEGIISINRPALSSNMVILSAAQISLIFYFSILFLPFVFFAAAVWIYRRRLKQ